MCPLAYGGPSCSTYFGAPRRFVRIWPYRSIASHRAMASGSAVWRLAFIGKPVRGRLTVSFHSGINLNGIAPAFALWGFGAAGSYNLLMGGVREEVLDNGLKV